MYIYILYYIVLIGQPIQWHTICPQSNTIALFFSFSVFCLLCALYSALCSMFYVLCFLPSTYPPHTHTCRHFANGMNAECLRYLKPYRQVAIYCSTTTKVVVMSEMMKKAETNKNNKGRTKGRKKGKRKNVEKSSTLLIHEYLFLFFATFATLRT